ncbi:MAG: YIP1 family protein [Silicimonas sp.]|nr:YIP1 family protein [Silicimonas sp.]
MSLVLDIARSYRAPREVQARRLAAGAREDRALAYLLGACALIFVAQWPRLAREAFLDPSITLEARMAGALFAWLMIMPLVFYTLSLIITLVLRITGQPVPGHDCRTVLFWALLASTPLWLLAGLMAGFAPGPGFGIFSAAALIAVLVFAAAGIKTARAGTLRPA